MRRPQLSLPFDLFRGSEPAGPRARRLSSRLLAGVVLPLVALAAIPAPAAAQTAPPARVALNIPAQPLASALTTLADQAGLRIFFPSQDLAGLRSLGLTGARDVEGALTDLLAGSGFGWRYREARVVVIERRPQSSAAPARPADGAIQLGAVRVQGSSAAGATQAGGSAAAGTPSPADAPYRTAGSSGYISEAEIQQNRGVSTGDFLRGETGVLNGDNRNSGALDVNIRGMQGMDRVPVVIDGSQQQSTVYRGYSGVAGRTYLDPDLVGGVVIEKGPTTSADGVGATGGVVRVKTIGVDDLVAPDRDFGFQFRVGGTGNTVSPPPVGTLGTGSGTAERFDRPDALNFQNGSVSIAAARRFDRFDLVAAYARRQTGNYFAGEEGTVPAAQGLRRYALGEEVLSTSQDNISYLLRLVVRPTDEQALDLSYISYRSDFGEMMPSQIIRFGGAMQAPLSRTEVDTYTARYRYKPEGSRRIDLKADLWATDNFTSIETLYRYVLPNGGTLNQDVAYMSQSDRWGATLTNASSFDTVAGALDLLYGGSYTNERLTPPKGWQDYKDNSGYTSFLEPRDGERDEYSAFVSGQLKPADWLTINGGLRYTRTESQDNNFAQPWAPDRHGKNHEKTSGVTPILSVLIEPLRGLQLYGRYAEAIRGPSLFESTTGFSFYPNPDVPLRPEHARNIEIGVNLQLDGLLAEDDVLQTKLAIFSNHIDDYLTRGNTADDFGTSVINIRSAAFEGVEWSGRYDAGRFFGEIGATVYTGTRFCDVDGLCREGNTVNSYIPAHIPPDVSGTATLGARLLDERLTLGARYTYMSDRDTDFVTFGGSTAVLEWEPYQLLDLWGSYRVNDTLSFDVAVDNVLDEYYMDALSTGLMPSPGRTVRLSLTSRFGGPDWRNSASTRASSLRGVLFGEPGLGVFDGDWSGLRLGVDAGYGWVKSQGRTTFGDGSEGAIPATESADIQAQDARLGLSLGYDWQVAGNWVVGIEGDFAWSPAQTDQYVRSTELRLPFSPPNAMANLQAAYLYDFDWSGSVRGRVGRAFGRTLVYGTGGVALLNERQRRTQYLDTAEVRNLTPARPFGTTSQPMFVEKVERLRNGWTVGGGVEVALNNSWSLRGEYLYSWFKKETFDFDQARAGVGKSFTFNRVIGQNPPTRVCVDMGPGQPPFCYDLPNPILERVDIVGTSDVVTGRQARNDAETHVLRVGLAYRF